MNKETAKTLLENGLTEITFNIDGATKETYEAAKTLCDFDKIKENVHNFIKLRDKINPKCQIHIKSLPAKRYIEFREHKKTDIPYDFPLMKEYWSKFLSKNDTITQGRYFGAWATKDFNSKLRKSPCSIMSQINNCYIDTEGNIYPCCVDYKTQLTFGNIMNISIYDIWNGAKRREFFENLVHKRFDKIGPPCVTCGEKTDYLKSYLEYLKYKVLK